MTIELLGKGGRFSTGQIASSSDLPENSWDLFLPSPHADGRKNCLVRIFPVVFRVEMAFIDFRRRNWIADILCQTVAAVRGSGHPQNVNFISPLTFQPS